MKISRAFFILLLSNVLLGIGLFAPAMTIIPSFGEYNGAIEALQPSYLMPTSFSIVSALAELFADGDWIIASVVLIFSVLFPLWKIGVLWNCWAVQDNTSDLRKRLHLIEKLGKFSMLDIFVMAMVVLIMKKLPGDTNVQLGWGVWCFVMSVLSAMLVPSVLRKK